MPDLASLRPLVAEILTGLERSTTGLLAGPAVCESWKRGAATMAWCDAFEGDLSADEAFELERLYSLEDAIEGLLDDKLTPAKFLAAVRELVRG